MDEGGGLEIRAGPSQNPFIRSNLRNQNTLRFPYNRTIPPDTDHGTPRNTSQTRYSPVIDIQSCRDPRTALRVHPL